MSTESLLAKAQRATSPGRPYINTDRWMPIVRTLRGKGWSYGQIYDWLKAEGEPVQANKSTFTSVVSRRYRRWLIQLTKPVA